MASSLWQTSFITAAFSDLAFSSAISRSSLLTVKSIKFFSTVFFRFTLASYAVFNFEASKAAILWVKRKYFVEIAKAYHNAKCIYTGLNKDNDIMQ